MGTCHVAVLSSQCFLWTHSAGPVQYLSMKVTFTAQRVKGMQVWKWFKEIHKSKNYSTNSSLFLFLFHRFSVLLQDMSVQRLEKEHSAELKDLAMEDAVKSTLGQKKQLEAGSHGMWTMGPWSSMVSLKVTKPGVRRLRFWLILVDGAEGWKIKLERIELYVLKTWNTSVLEGL